MRLHRQADRDRVSLSDTPSATVNGRYGAEIIRLRKAMSAAVTKLYEDRPDDAQRLLSAALAERWWT